MGKSTKLPKAMKGVSGDKGVADPVLQFDPYANSILPMSERVNKKKSTPAPTWDEFMAKQRAKERDDPDSLLHMASYRQELDRARDEKLSAGHNHKDLRKKDKKKKDKKKSKKKDKKKDKKKRKERSESSSNDSTDSEPASKRAKDEGPVRLSQFMDSDEDTGK